MSLWGTDDLYCLGAIENARLVGSIYPGWTLRVYCDPAVPVLDELRRNDWAPRSLRRWERDISRSREKFIALYGRAPSHDELAASVELTPAELDRWLGDIQRSEVGSLNVLVLGEDDTTIERIDTL